MAKVTYHADQRLVFGAKVARYAEYLHLLGREVDQAYGIKSNEYFIT